MFGEIKRMFEDENAMGCQQFIGMPLLGFAEGGQEWYKLLGKLFENLFDMC
ncbi:MAG: hypothetical protein MASP_00070 [Candidatus Methanolliviera sp. GoM_asphalt]|nr:MAG: hypothetical protein MASP_00070 [Candidatus Methanolliviera sp. GoM_asphalt]